MNHQYSDLVLE